MTVARSNGKPIPLTVVTGGAGWLWLAVRWSWQDAENK